MFEDITTLQQLNAARADAIRDGSTDIMSINNDYNTARARILSSRKPYKQATKHVVNVDTPADIATIPIVGPNQNFATITFTKQGFLI